MTTKGLFHELAVHKGIFRFVSILLIALPLAGCGLTKVRFADASHINATWPGTIQCKDGDRKAELTVQGKQNGEVQARLKLTAHPSTPNPPNGEYSMIGGYHSAGFTDSGNYNSSPWLVLHFNEWISEPMSYSRMDFSGFTDKEHENTPGKIYYEGKVYGANSNTRGVTCQEFRFLMN